LKILVTGVAGFIGSHVATALIEQGASVLGIDNMNDYYDLRLKEARLNRLNSLPRFRFEHTDISDHVALTVLAERHNDLTGIVHLAAQAGVRYSLVNPYAYVDANLMGQVAMFELAKKLPNLEHFVYASSSSVYGANKKSPFSVQDAVERPISLYAASKRADELIAYTYSHINGLPATGLRFFTVYGPWGRPDMAAYLFTEAILGGRPIMVFNHGDMQRDFTYIDDIVAGVIAALHRPAAPDADGVRHRVYNLGNDRPEQLIHFIDVLETALGRKAIRELMPMQPGDVAATWADITESRRDLGFEPKVSIEEGIPRFVDWYNNYKAIMRGVLPHKSGLQNQLADQPDLEPARPRRILIDGIIFQYLDSGIARLWRCLLTEWSVDPEFSGQIILLDRNGSAPRIDGITTKLIRAHDYMPPGADSLYLQAVCDEEEADLFISTYYTTPTTTPSIFYGYDMIPEVIGANLADECWREKHRAIEHAGRHIMISHSSADDLERLFPIVATGTTLVVYCALGSGFGVAEPDEIAEFRRRHNLTKPYLLTVGDRSGLGGYKNGKLIFQALAQLPEAEDYDLILVGGQQEIEPELVSIKIKSRVHHLRLSDHDLKCAYSGAVALLYPSRYEGFGLPILEAMACGCPVITCDNSSIPEVAGKAAMYVGADAPEELVEAIRQISDPAIRAVRTAAGLAQAGTFPSSRMAEAVKTIFLTTPLVPPAKIWLDFRQIQITRLYTRRWRRFLPEPARRLAKRLIRLAKIVRLRAKQSARPLANVARRTRRRLMSEL
jgi:UDP-glucuronate 4-epimerase